MSMVLAVAMFIVGFFIFNILLLIIAVFVYLGAMSEGQHMLIKQNLKGNSLKDFITGKEKIPKIEAELSLKEVFDYFKEKNIVKAVIPLDGAYYLFNLDSFKRVNRKDWGKVQAISVSKKLPNVNLRSSAEKVFQKMVAESIPLAPVFEKDKFIGFIEEKELLKAFELNKLKSK